MQIAPQDIKGTRRKDRTMRIKFSHIYKKLLDEHNDMLENARLIEVLPVELSQLSRFMRDYDTDLGKYELPKSGKYLMLIFLKPSEPYICAANIFTTIRRATPEKERYYRSRIGHVFEIEYTGAKDGDAISIQQTVARLEPEQQIENSRVPVLDPNLQNK